jgi:hypothetical protein
MDEARVRMLVPASLYDSRIQACPNRQEPPPHLLCKITSVRYTISPGSPLSSVRKTRQYGSLARRRSIFGKLVASTIVTRSRPCDWEDELSLIGGFIKATCFEMAPWRRGENSDT